MCLCSWQPSPAFSLKAVETPPEDGQQKCSCKKDCESKVDMALVMSNRELFAKMPEKERSESLWLRVSGQAIVFLLGNALCTCCHRQASSMDAVCFAFVCLRGNMAKDIYHGHIEHSRYHISHLRHEFLLVCYLLLIGHSVLVAVSFLPSGQMAMVSKWLAI